jgi:hypothetical protein
VHSSFVDHLVSGGAHPFAVTIDGSIDATGDTGRSAPVRRLVIIGK